MANEKRLIDANLLVKDLEFLAKHEDSFRQSVILGVVQTVNTRPTVEAVEIVRCEKCKHAVWDEETKLWKCVESAEYDEELGEWFGFFEYHYGDFFCSYGERKDGDE